MTIPEKGMAEKKRGDLRSIKEISGFEIIAKDGRIGKLDECYFDDISWTVRYFVVNTGSWLTGRQVLISPSAVLQPDWDRKMLPVQLTREQVEQSPGIDSDKAVSRQHQLQMYNYYGWPPYWTAPGIPLAAMPPAELPDMAAADRTEEEKGDPHLRSSKEVIGYRIQAGDEKIGEVEDFLADDKTWAIRYMVVDTRVWLPGKKVLVAVSWIRKIEWADKLISVDQSRDLIKNAPEYSAPSLVNLEYEKRLLAYYNLPSE